MEPAFAAGSTVVISPVSFIWRPPRRGEVIGLYSPEDKERFELKRIVGLPGEAVSWKGGLIWINGQPLLESYAIATSAIPGEEPRRLELGPGEYFVVGDNRLYSRDSRLYGPVWLTDIVGQVLPSEN